MGGIVAGRAHAHILGGSFQRGKVRILHVGQQQGGIRCQGDGVFLPHLLLHPLKFCMEGSSVRAALGVTGDRIGAPPQISHSAAGVVVAQLDVAAGGVRVKVQDVPQLPVAAHHDGGQAGEVRAGDAHPLKVYAHQLLCAHPFGKAGGHVVAVAAIQKLDPVDVPRPQGREAGGGGHQVVLDLSCRDLVQRQLPGLEAPLLHRNKAKADGCGAQGILVQHPLHDLLQRGHVHAAGLHHTAQELVQGREVCILFRQLHHVLAADAQPHVPRRFVLVQHEHGTVQAAHTGAGDDLRVPVQLHQRAPHTHLIAAAGTAAGQHQSPARDTAFFHCLRLLRLVPVLFRL